MLRARGREEQRLRLGRQVHFACVQEDVADALREWRPAGLSREEHLAIARAQTLGESRGLDRLAGSLPALEREEDATHR